MINESTLAYSIRIRGAIKTISTLKKEYKNFNKNVSEFAEFLNKIGSKAEIEFLIKYIDPEDKFYEILKKAVGNEKMNDNEIDNQLKEFEKKLIKLEKDLDKMKKLLENF